ncbi:MAG: sugar O-acetyltransferase [Tractidigestivibacter sp.]|jgi:maltose O-acetyltransferase|uniref:sugar O-acetyltransferase n=1 Tax=Tractidigestivibacter sp. TaxID=2847320 RepID=UPI003D8A142B
MADVEMTELQKLEAGLEYHYDDPEVAARKTQAVTACARLAATDQNDAEAYEAAARAILGSAGTHLDIQPGFHCDYGKNIHVGDEFTANYNVTILDIAPVTIGDHCMLGPGTLITTVGHPVDGARRRGHVAFAKPVTLGDDVWVGGSASIMPGITIGSNVVVGAGAVVTHDVPSNCVVAGVPARVIRQLEPEG